jgi:hypothetical protein
MDTSNSKKVNEILRTKDYSIFKVNEHNRVIIPSHVKRLTQSMLVNGWQKGSYMVTDRNYNVIDGQHRLEAAKIANVPVEYAVEVKATADSIRMLNTNSKNWNIIDHLRYHVEAGNQNYVLLDRFMKNFPDFRPTECMMLVKNSMSSAERGEFESGQFVVKDMKKAYAWGHQIMSLKPYFDSGYCKSIFVRALMKVFLNKPEFNFDEFLHKIHIRPRSIYMCGTVDQYVEMIEDIYNYKRKVDEKVNLRF